MNARVGEIVKLQRSSAYWVSRASRHRREGNRRRAAALLRHALTLSPADGDLRMEYAKTLQEMECYEASNRAAFGALTLNPKRYACYGLIGSNMLALGYEQEAMDAFSRYLWAVKRAGDVPEFDDELDELEEFENDQPHLRARHEVQLSIASRRLANGDLAGAQEALERAKPAQDSDDRYDALRSLLLQAQGDDAGAIQSALRACKRNPFSARARCTLAGAYCQAGQRVKGASAVLAAALRCETAQDEQLYCYSAVSLGFPELALCVLRRATRISPDRMPAVFNTCVVMLKLGRLDTAEPLIHQCRDLDPTDVPARCTYRTMEQWRDLLLTPEQVRIAARALPFYPQISPAERNDCLAQLAKALGEGVEAFCRELAINENLYTLLLYELGETEHQLSRLIPIIVANLPKELAQRMLREVLVQQTPDDSVKRYAAAALMSIGAKPPFVVWHAGRIAEIDPYVQTRRDANFSRAMLVRRMADIQHKTGDSRLMTHALRILNKMGKHRRMGVVRDMDSIFRAALEQHYLLTYGLPDNNRLQKLLRYTADERRRVRAIFQIFNRVVPVPGKHPRR